MGTFKKNQIKRLVQGIDFYLQLVDWAWLCLGLVLQFNSF